MKGRKARSEREEGRMRRKGKKENKVERES